MNCTTHLGESLALAAAALGPSTAVTNQPGGLRLDLPPLGFRPAGALPDAGALRVLAALYLYAEHERSGIIPVAEVLADARYSLPVRDTRAAGKLETFARKAPQWYSRAERSALFERLFGLDSSAGSAVGNRDFQRVFAAFCLSITALASAGRWGQTSGASEEAHAAAACLELLSNLGQRQSGNALIGARVIHDQLASAVDLLTDPAMLTSFQAQGLWDLLRRIIGDQPPDFGRLSTRGQSGQRLLEWLASALPQLSRTPPRVPPAATQSQVATWAAQWLDATGILPAAYARAVAV